MGAKRSLGQHFLVDERVVARIVAAVPATPTTIVEIGPGRGALTEPLLATGRPLILVEKDRELAASWRRRTTPRVHVLEADAADTAWLAALPPDLEAVVVGNLPYNAATPILRRLLTRHDRFPVLVLMFQREVAERLLAGGGRQGGPMGLLTQLYYTVEPIATVPPGAFRPVPKVTSKVVRLRRRPEAPAPATVERLWPLVLQLFARRRARLEPQLARAFGIDRTQAGVLMTRAGIRRDARPDHLTPEQLRRLLRDVGMLP